MDAKVEALVTQWELLKNELNNEIKNTDVYKKVKSWRTENEERIAEFNNIKNAQQEYEKLLDKIKNIEQSCKDENNQKNKAVLKVLREKRQNFKIREKTTKFNKIQNDFLKFIYKIEAILLGEMGIEGDWKGIITSDYDIFLERIIASLLYFVNSELETIMNDKIKTKLKEISKCEKEINNEFCIKFPDADNLGCIDNKIERLKNEYVKYSKNEYEDYVRKVYYN
ncbi:hypothetical protein HK103_006284 [Boothiomyces macroporosus]|uniref:Uncharacterized protein n=1 Tax=Boothiomyces macroporosus TaxID=261099 RepID=A0AAD5UE32_9FUNG|nr:hypothetical protein HK103_006284 [Boothiomyces macroporosus]